MLVACLAAIIPLSDWLRRNPRQTPKIWTLVGFMPFVLGALHLFMAVISWPEWPGFVPGFEFSVLDAIVLSIYLSLPRARSPLPFRFSMALYFLAVVFSALHAAVIMPALFYAWQLARVFLVYAVVTRACADPRVAPAILNGTAAGIIMQAGYAIVERFGLGILQTSGTFAHQNLLGLISHLVVFPFFALMLATKRGWLAPAVVAAGIVIEVLTTSRATLGFAVFGFATLLLLSVLRQNTSRKMFVLVIGVVAITVVSPFVVSSFERRFAAEGEDSGYDEREAFKKAAAMILSDYPFGVGANNYVIVANTGGYNTRAGVAAVDTSGRAEVHNIYWLVASETGYLGLITFVLLLLCPLTVALRCGWRNRRDQRGDLLLGLGVALLTVYLHSFFEWIFITIEVQYMFALDVGLVAGLAEQLGYWRRPYHRVARPANLHSHGLAENRSVPGAQSPAIVAPGNIPSKGLLGR